MVMTRFLLLTLLAVCTSCADRVIYSESIDIDKTGWDINDTLYFDVELTDTISCLISV